MPTYEYQCRSCGSRFARQQAMTDEAITTCPECGGAIERLITGGGGFIMKGGGAVPRGNSGVCSLETTGRTCCGREQLCDRPPRGD